MPYSVNGLGFDCDSTMPASLRSVGNALGYLDVKLELRLGVDGRGLSLPTVALVVERDRTARRCGSGAKATGREWRKESAPAGARQGGRCRDR